MGKIIGKIKQAAGKITGNKRLEREGKLEQVKGKAKRAVDGVKRAVKRAKK